MSVRSSRARVVVTLVLLGALAALFWSRGLRRVPASGAETPGLVSAREKEATGSAFEKGASAAPADISPETRAARAQETGILEVDQWRVRIPLREDRRPDFSRVGNGVFERVRREVPAAVAAFENWLTRLEASAPEQRAALLEEGDGLLGKRMAAWPEWAARDPEAAILFSPSAARRALLPDGMALRLEQPVAGAGFYGVRASCGHGVDGAHGATCRIDHDVILGDRVLRAAIYGDRRERLTEEDASLYGVALGDLIALHADDLVVRPVGTDPRSTLEIIYRGNVVRIDDAAQLSARIQTFITP